MSAARVISFVLLAGAALAAPPSFEPAHDITFSGASTSVNREGLAQQWQVAPDASLPRDFAEGGALV